MHPVASCERIPTASDNDQRSRLTMFGDVDLLSELQKVRCCSIHASLTKFDFDRGPRSIFCFNNHINFTSVVVTIIR